MISLIREIMRIFRNRRDRGAKVKIFLTIETLLAVDLHDRVLANGLSNDFKQDRGRAFP